MPSKTLVAIISLTLIIGFAIWQGVNGSLVSTGVLGIIGLGGYAIAKSQHPQGK